MSVDSLTPREQRSSVIIRAVVRPPVGTATERRVRNLSATGACLDHTGELLPGDDIVLEMGALTDLGAKVRWSAERLAGISFHHPIDLEAARKPRGAAVVVASGWLADLKDAYR